MLTVAHAFGNSLASLPLALATGVDMIEADVWFHRGRWVVRHERQLGALPILYDRKDASRHADGDGPGALGIGRWWRLRFQKDPLTLAKLVAAISKDKGLLLDIKGEDSASREECVESLLGFLKANDLTGRVALCGYSWPLLRALAVADSGLPVFYSANTGQRLTGMLQHLDDSGFLPRGVSIDHALLDEGTVDTFKRKGLAILSWTVDDLGLARRLQSLGVAGVISNNLELLEALKQPTR